MAHESKPTPRPAPPVVVARRDGRHRLPAPAWRLATRDRRMPRRLDPGPAASELERSPEPTTLLLVLTCLAAVAWGLWQWQHPASRARPVPPAVAATLEVPPYHQLPSGELLRWADDPRFEVRRQAVLELGRRGSLGELNHLRRHARADVRAAVPTAFLAWGPAAHRHIPWLAEGLHDHDPAVRRRTAGALNDLVRRFGPYRGELIGPAPEEVPVLAERPRARD